jgi:hypothetical protein
MHLKPTAECQISILIFENKLWRGGLYKYPMTNISRTAKFSSLIYFLWDIYRDPLLHNFFSNIRIDISHPAVGLRCIIPPKGIALVFN